MKIAVFDTHHFERSPLTAANEKLKHELVFLEARLNSTTASLAEGFTVISSFANDQLDQKALEVLRQAGVKLVALRSAGFNHVDLAEAERLGIQVVRVPAYSPNSVAEHAVCLVMALNRNIHRAYARVREMNFSLDGLVGFDMYGKTVGVIGAGRIGAVFCRIMAGFGCRVLVYDSNRNAKLAALAGLEYVDLERIYEAADVISLHVPLTLETRHLIDANAMAKMKRGVMLINTSRGALIETRALVSSLKSGQIGAAGLDVYEEEENVFFKDLSGKVLQDDLLARLLTFPNVLITSHQGFLTQEALRGIAETTLQSISDFEAGRPLLNEIRAPNASARHSDGT